MRRISRSMISVRLKMFFLRIFLLSESTSVRAAAVLPVAASSAAAAAAGASAAASMGEQGYQVKSFCISDSPRRAHSIAAQGGINAAKNYQNDGDSVRRLFQDTIKGGDYRAREANVYRLAQVSNAIIDQCVAQGVPFAREYGGELSNRSFGGAQVSRTFYARGQTGQQLLIGAYQALERQVAQFVASYASSAWSAISYAGRTTTEFVTVVDGTEYKRETIPLVLTSSP